MRTRFIHSSGKAIWSKMVFFHKHVLLRTKPSIQQKKDASDVWGGCPCNLCIVFKCVLFLTDTLHHALYQFYFQITGVVSHWNTLYTSWVTQLCCDWRMNVQKLKERKNKSRISPDLEKKLKSQRIYSHMWSCRSFFLQHSLWVSLSIWWQADSEMGSWVDINLCILFTYNSAK